MYTAIFRYRDFIRFMIDRERTGVLYKTVLGKGWLIVEPLVHMAIYYFLVVIIFHRAGMNGVDPFVAIMTGLTHYLFFQKALLGSCRAILGHEGLLLQVAIEPIVLNAVNYFRHIYNFAITLAIFGIAYVWIGPQSWPNIAWYPLCLLALFVLVWLWTIILSVLTVFFRDLQNLSAIVLRIVMYLSPVIYTLDFVPEEHRGLPLRTLYLLNPVASLFSFIQWSLIGGVSPPPIALGVVAAFLLVSLVVAHALYISLRPKITKSF
jgi:ABC-type polysaccharide/polyol phosphate export permease